MARLTPDKALQLAESCEAIGDFASASAVYAAMLRANPADARVEALLAAVPEKQSRFANASDLPHQAVLELAELLRRKELARLKKACTALLGQFDGNYHLLLLLGSAEKFLRQHDNAEAALRKAAAARPQSATPWQYLGDLFAEANRIDDALEAYSRALELDPGNRERLALQLAFRVHQCDWSALDELEDLRTSDPDAFLKIDPFKMLSLRDDLADHSRRSRRLATKFAPFTNPPIPPWPKQPGERIRIGYFSADFGDHPVMNLISGVFREHDRDRFEVYAFSLGAENASPLRARLKRDVEHFVDLSAENFGAVAAKARAARIDIAVNLMGYTINGPTEAFATRLAPIQVNFLGYPGTMGGDFMDFIVADPVLIPPESRQAYAEEVLYLPGSYMPSDNLREIGPPTRRSDHGLPNDAFVLCCFNQAYKIGPREFAIWMRILRQVEGSVLWLKQPGPSAQENLQRSARDQGVDPDRLIFAGRLAHPEHIERHRHADVFADTFCFNAHTTANEALWGGLPVVTRAGEQFSARVAASLLTASGLPELVTDCDEAYEALLLKLATDRALLANITAKLRDGRDTCALFDTVRYTRGLEAAYMTALERTSSV